MIGDHRVGLHSWVLAGERRWVPSTPVAREHKMAATVDRVEGPSAPPHRLLGDPKPHYPVVPAPDQRHGDSDRRELVGRDPARTPSHEPTVGFAHARLGDPVEVVGLESAQAVPIAVRTRSGSVITYWKNRPLAAVLGRLM
jgi:hypothetical protein